LLLVQASAEGRCVVVVVVLLHIHSIWQGGREVVVLRGGEELNGS
jgi:hypothetical protein